MEGEEIRGGEVIGDGDVSADVMEKGSLSPLTGSYLLIVLAEPHSEEDREIILQRLNKGLLSWDVDSSHVDLNCELLNLTNSNPEGDEARNGEKLVQWASENLVVEVLIHSQVNTLQQCMKNLLASFTRHRHIIHAGYTFQGSGSWVLQDGTFSLSDYLELWGEGEVQRILSAYKGDISVSMHCASENGWTQERLCKEPFAKLCQITINPDDKMSQIHNSGIGAFSEFISKMLIPSPIKEILEPSDIVGNIRFSHPTLYVFPGGQGDAALFGINGFNMLIDGGFARKACFWDFTRHLDRLDAVLLTRINNNSVGGLSSVIQRKVMSQVYPQIGHFFGNVIERKGSSEDKKDEGAQKQEKLLVSLNDEGHRIVENLRNINLKPHLCFRETHIEPINLYHKVGHGKLDLYVLNPAKDSREVKEFLSKWNSDCKSFVSSRMSSRTSDGKDFQFPILNLVSICALLVWQPANPRDPITRILFPGSTPQHKIFEALGKLKHLEFLRYPVCTAKTIAASHRSQAKSEKVISEAKEQLSKVGSHSNVQTIHTSSTDGSLSRTHVSKTSSTSGVHRSSSHSKVASASSLKEDTTSTTVRERPAKRAVSKAGEDSNKIQTKLSESPSQVKRQIKATSKSTLGKTPSVAGSKEPPKKKEVTAPPVTKKISPTSPAKKIESKVKTLSKLGSVKDSPPQTPPKSAKDANNRRVIEHKSTKSKTESQQVKPLPRVDIKKKVPLAKSSIPTSVGSKSPTKKSIIPKKTAAGVAAAAAGATAVAVTRRGSKESRVTKKISDDQEGAEKKIQAETNGSISHTKQSQEEIQEQQEEDQTQEDQPSSLQPASLPFESGSELSSLDHISVQEETASTSDLSKEQFDSETLQPAESEQEEEEEEYLIVEKDESTDNAESERVLTKTLGSLDEPCPSIPEDKAPEFEEDDTEDKIAKDEEPEVEKDLAVEIDKDSPKATMQEQTGDESSDQTKLDDREPVTATEEIKVTEIGEDKTEVQPPETAETETKDTGIVSAEETKISSDKTQDDGDKGEKGSETQEDSQIPDDLSKTDETTKEDTVEEKKEQVDEIQDQVNVEEVQKQEQTEESKQEEIIEKVELKEDEKVEVNEEKTEEKVEEEKTQEKAEGEKTDEKDEEKTHDEIADKIQENVAEVGTAEEKGEEEKPKEKDEGEKTEEKDEAEKAEAKVKEEKAEEKDEGEKTEETVEVEKSEEKGEIKTEEKDEEEAHDEVPEKIQEKVGDKVTDVGTAEEKEERETETATEEAKAVSQRDEEEKTEIEKDVEKEPLKNVSETESTKLELKEVLEPEVGRGSEEAGVALKTEDEGESAPELPHEKLADTNELVERDILGHFPGSNQEEQDKLEDEAVPVKEILEDQQEKLEVVCPVGKEESEEQTGKPPGQETQKEDVPPKVETNTVESILPELTEKEELATQQLQLDSHEHPINEQAETQPQLDQYTPSTARTDVEQDDLPIHHELGEAELSHQIAPDQSQVESKSQQEVPEVALEAKDKTLDPEEEQPAVEETIQKGDIKQSETAPSETTEAETKEEDSGKAPESALEKVPCSEKLKASDLIPEPETAVEKSASELKEPEIESQADKDKQEEPAQTLEISAEKPQTSEATDVTEGSDEMIKESVPEKEIEESLNLAAEIDAAEKIAEKKESILAQPLESEREEKSQLIEDAEKSAVKIESADEVVSAEIQESEDTKIADVTTDDVTSAVTALKEEKGSTHEADLSVRKETESTEKAEEAKTTEIEEESTITEIAEKSKTAEIEDESKTTEILDESKTAEVAEESKTAEIEDESKTTEISDKSKTAEIEDESKTTEIADESKTAEIADESKPAEVVDESKTAETVEAEITEIADKETKTTEIAEESKTAKIVDESITAEIADESKTTEIADKSKTTETVEAEITETADQESKTAEIAEESKTAEIAEESKPAETAEESKPAEIAEESKTAEIAEESKTSEESKTIDAAEESKTAETAEESKTAETAEESKITDAAEETKPAETAEESKTTDAAKETKTTGVTEDSKTTEVVEESKTAEAVEESKTSETVEAETTETAEKEAETTETAEKEAETVKMIEEAKATDTTEESETIVKAEVKATDTTEESKTTETVVEAETIETARKEAETAEKVKEEIKSVTQVEEAEAAEKVKEDIESSTKAEETEGAEKIEKQVDTAEQLEKEIETTEKVVEETASSPVKADEKSTTEAEIDVSAKVETSEIQVESKVSTTDVVEISEKLESSEQEAVQTSKPGEDAADDEQSTAEKSDLEQSEKSEKSEAALSGDKVATEESIKLIAEEAAAPEDITEKVSEGHEKDSQAESSEVSGKMETEKIALSSADEKTEDGAKAEKEEAPEKLPSEESKAQEDHEVEIQEPEIISKKIDEATKAAEKPTGDTKIEKTITDDVPKDEPSKQSEEIETSEVVAKTSEAKTAEPAEIVSKPESESKKVEPDEVKSEKSEDVKTLETEEAKSELPEQPVEKIESTAAVVTGEKLAETVPSETVDESSKTLHEARDEKQSTEEKPTAVIAAADEDTAEKIQVSLETTTKAESITQSETDSVSAKDQESDTLETSATKLSESESAQTSIEKSELLAEAVLSDTVSKEEPSPKAELPSEVIKPESEEKIPSKSPSPQPEPEVVEVIKSPTQKETPVIKDAESVKDVPAVPKVDTTSTEELKIEKEVAGQQPEEQSKPSEDVQTLSKIQSSELKEDIITVITSDKSGEEPEEVKQVPVTETSDSPQPQKSDQLQEQLPKQEEPIKSEKEITLESSEKEILRETSETASEKSLEKEQEVSLPEEKESFPSQKDAPPEKRLDPEKEIGSESVLQQKTELVSKGEKSVESSLEPVQNILDEPIITTSEGGEPLQDVKSEISSTATTQIQKDETQVEKEQQDSSKVAKSLDTQDQDTKIAEENTEVDQRKGEEAEEKVQEKATQEVEKEVEEIAQEKVEKVEAKVEQVMTKDVEHPQALTEDVQGVSGGEQVKEESIQVPSQPERNDEQFNLKEGLEPSESILDKDKDASKVGAERMTQSEKSDLKESEEKMKAEKSSEVELGEQVEKAVSLEKEEGVQEEKEKDEGQEPRGGEEKEIEESKFIRPLPYDETIDSQEGLDKLLRAGRTLIDKESSKRKDEEKVVGIPSAIAKLPRESREVIRTPDEVADLPVHEEVEPGTYETDELIDEPDTEEYSEEDQGVDAIGIVNIPQSPSPQKQLEEEINTTHASETNQVTKPITLPEIAPLPEASSDAVTKIDAAVSPVLESLLGQSPPKAFPEVMQVASQKSTEISPQAPLEETTQAKPSQTQIEPDDKSKSTEILLVTEAKTESQAAAEPVVLDSKMEIEIKADSETKTDIKSEHKTETDVVVESKVETEVTSESKFETAVTTESKLETVEDTKRETVSDAKTEAISEVKAESVSDAKIEEISEIKTDHVSDTKPDIDLKNEAGDGKTVEKSPEMQSSPVLTEKSKPASEQEKVPADSPQPSKDQTHDITQASDALDISAKLEESSEKLQKSDHSSSSLTGSKDGETKSDKEVHAQGVPAEASNTKGGIIIEKSSVPGEHHGSDGGESDVKEGRSTDGGSEVVSDTTVSPVKISCETELGSSQKQIDSTELSPRERESEEKELSLNMKPIASVVITPSTPPVQIQDRMEFSYPQQSDSPTSSQTDQTQVTEIINEQPKLVETDEKPGEKAVDGLVSSEALERKLSWNSDESSTSSQTPLTAISKEKEPQVPSEKPAEATALDKSPVELTPVLSSDETKTDEPAIKSTESSPKSSKAGSRRSSKADSRRSSKVELKEGGEKLFLLPGKDDDDKSDVDDEDIYETDEPALGAVRSGLLTAATTLSAAVISQSPEDLATIPPFIPILPEDEQLVATAVESSLIITQESQEGDKSPGSPITHIVETIEKIETHAESQQKIEPTSETQKITSPQVEKEVTSSETISKVELSSLLSSEEKVSESSVEKLSASLLEEQIVSAADKLEVSKLDKAEDYTDQKVADGVEKAPESTVEKVSESAVEKASESPLEKVSESAIEKSSASTVQKVSESTVEKVSDSTVEKVSESIVEKVTEYTAEKVSQSAVEKESESVVEKVFESTVDKASESAVEKSSESVVEKSEPTVEKVSETAVVKATESTAEKVSESAVEKASESVVEKVSESTVEKLSESTVEKVSESAVEKESKSLVETKSASTVEKVSESVIETESASTVEQVSESTKITESRLEKAIESELHELSASSHKEIASLEISSAAKGKEESELEKADETTLKVEQSLVDKTEDTITTIATQQSDLNLINEITPSTSTALGTPEPAHTITAITETSSAVTLTSVSSSESTVISSETLHSINTSAVPDQSVAPGIENKASTDGVASTGSLDSTLRSIAQECKDEEKLPADNKQQSSLSSELANKLVPTEATGESSEERKASIAEESSPLQQNDISTDIGEKEKQDEEKPIVSLSEEIRTALSTAEAIDPTINPSTDISPISAVITQPTSTSSSLLPDSVVFADSLVVDTPSHAKPALLDEGSPTASQLRRESSEIIPGPSHDDKGTSEEKILQDSMSAETEIEKAQQVVSSIVEAAEEKVEEKAQQAEEIIKQVEEKLESSLIDANQKIPESASGLGGSLIDDKEMQLEELSKEKSLPDEDDEDSLEEKAEGESLEKAEGESTEKLLGQELNKTGIELSDLPISSDTKAEMKSIPSPTVPDIEKPLEISHTQIISQSPSAYATESFPSTSKETSGPEAGQASSKRSSITTEKLSGQAELLKEQSECTEKVKIQKEEKTEIKTQEVEFQKGVMETEAQQGRDEKVKTEQEKVEEVTVKSIDEGNKQLSSVETSVEKIVEVQEQGVNEVITKTTSSPVRSEIDLIEIGGKGSGAELVSIISSEIKSKESAADTHTSSAQKDTQVSRDEWSVEKVAGTDGKECPEQHEDVVESKKDDGSSPAGESPSQPKCTSDSHSSMFTSKFETTSLTAVTESNIEKAPQTSSQASASQLQEQTSDVTTLKLSQVTNVSQADGSSKHEDISKLGSSTTQEIRKVGDIIESDVSQMQSSKTVEISKSDTSKAEVTSKTDISTAEVSSKTDISATEVISKIETSKIEDSSKTDTSKAEVTSRTDTSKTEVVSQTGTSKKEEISITDASKVEIISKSDTSKAEAISKTDSSKTESGSKTDTSKTESGSKTDTSKTESVSKTEIVSKTDTSKTESVSKTDTSKTESVSQTDTSKTESDSKTDTSKIGASITEKVSAVISSEAGDISKVKEPSLSSGTSKSEVVSKSEETSKVADAAKPDDSSKLTISSKVDDASKVDTKQDSKQESQSKEESSDVFTSQALPGEVSKDSQRSTLTRRFSSQEVSEKNFQSSETRRRASEIIEHSEEIAEASSMTSSSMTGAKQFVEITNEKEILRTSPGGSYYSGYGYVFGSAADEEEEPQTDEESVYGEDSQSHSLSIKEGQSITTTKTVPETVIRTTTITTTKILDKPEGLALSHDLIDEGSYSSGDFSDSQLSTVAGVKDLEEEHLEPLEVSKVESKSEIISKVETPAKTVTITKIETPGKTEIISETVSETLSKIQIPSTGEIISKVEIPARTEIISGTTGVIQIISKTGSSGKTETITKEIKELPSSETLSETLSKMDFPGKSEMMKQIESLTKMEIPGTSEILTKFEIPGKSELLSKFEIPGTSEFLSKFDIPGTSDSGKTEVQKTVTVTTDISDKTERGTAEKLETGKVEERVTSKSQDIDNGNVVIGSIVERVTTTTTTTTHRTTGKDDDKVGTSSFSSEFEFASTSAPSSSSRQKEAEDEDIVKAWGKPLGLPPVQSDEAAPHSNEPESSSSLAKGTPKKDKSVDRKNPGTPAKTGHSSSSRGRTHHRSSKNCNPIYVDLAYVPHHGNSNYCDSEFFRLIRARYYVFSGLEPSRQVFDGLLQGKQAWDDKNLEVTIIPTYDTDTLGYWVVDSEDALAEARIDLAPSASRCTINLQDHETSCSAYRLEF